MKDNNMFTYVDSDNNSLSAIEIGYLNEMISEGIIDGDVIITMTHKELIDEIIEYVFK
ncbi:hypothetical protein PYDG_00006 [Pseudoalteromonas phage pYD6-A]|uniref:Uncharacterized protein n=1 Tax=Pseudoalteromonas phage pYD6-A TaxID=754052 RepID=M4SNB9_9CAUD|nr:hypothetical protein PYDG_00006 [Pseudoalteromonas phage pYD6-A]AGH57538.1 hypothetical protein PYDG_00006 [Pseudoalteromonas phage pYD6-A]